MTGKYLIGLLSGGALVCAAACSGAGTETSNPGESAGQQVAKSTAAGASIVIASPRAGAGFSQSGAIFESLGRVTSRVSPEAIQLAVGSAQPVSVVTHVAGTGSTAPWRAVDGELQRKLSDNVSERLVSLEKGVQTVWEVAERPAGKFQSSIEVGGTLRRADSDGLLFERDGKFYRVSHGSWFDARGHHTHIPAQFANGRVSYRVPAAVLDNSQFPARLDPIISAEFFASPALDVDAYGGGTVVKIMERSNGDVLFFSGSSFGSGTLQVRGVDPSDDSLKLAFDASSLAPSFTVIDSVMVGDQLVVAGLDGGQVNVQRIDLTTLDWADPAAIPVSDILNNVAVGVQQGGWLRLASNGTSLLVTWTDDVNSGTQGTDLGYALLDATSLAKTASGVLHTTSATSLDDAPAYIAVSDDGTFTVISSAGGADSTVFTFDAAGAPTGTTVLAGRGVGLVGLSTGSGVLELDSSNDIAYLVFDSSGAQVGSPLALGAWTGVAMTRVPTHGVLVQAAVPTLITGGVANSLTAPAWFSGTVPRPSLRLLGLSTGQVASSRDLDTGSTADPNLGATLTINAGAVIAGADYPVASRFVNKGGELAAAYDATEDTYYVVWNEVNDSNVGVLRLAAYDPGATSPKFGPLTIHTQTQAQNDFYTDLDLVADGGTLVAKWTLSRRGGSDLYLPLIQRFQASDGAAIDSGPVALSATSIEDFDGAPSVHLAWGGGTLHASWINQSNSTQTRVTVDTTAATMVPQTETAPELLPFGPILGNSVAGYVPGTGSAIYGTALTTASKIADLCTTQSAGSGVGSGEDWRDFRIIAGSTTYFLGCSDVTEIISASDGSIVSTPGEFSGSFLSGYAAPHFLSVFGSPGGGLGGSNFLMPIGADLDANWTVSSAFSDGTVMPDFGTTGSVAVDPIGLQKQVATAGPGLMMLGYFGQQAGAGVNQVMLRWIDPGAALADSCTTDDDCASGVCDNGTCAVPVVGTGGAGGTGGSGTGGAGTGGSAGSATGGTGAGGSATGGAGAGGPGTGGSGNGGSGNGGSGNGGSSTAGAGNSSGAPAAASAKEDDGGCGCSTPGQRNSAPGGLALGLGLLGWAASRRRRRS